MPRKKKKRRNIPAYLLLCALVIGISMLMRSATPYVVPESAILATAKPIATDEPVYTEPPVTAAPLETQAPTPSPTPEPVITDEPVVVPPRIEESSNIYGSAGLLASDTSAAPTATVTATAMPTMTAANAVTPTPIPTPVPTADPATWTNVIVMPTATPRPGPTPTYEYSTDEIRIEIVRHAEDKLVYFAAEIWLTDARQLKSAFSSDRFDGATESVSDIAERNGAIFAINGDFATFNNGGIIIRNGDVYRTNDSTRQLLVIDRNGDFIPYVDPPSDPDAAAAQFLEEGVLHTLVFGPVLVENGVAVPLPKNFFINTKGAHEPRTVIAQLGPLHYLFLVVDGRQDDYSKGVSLERLQEMMLEYNVITAFNLDGGGSSTMTFHGNVLNRPANGGERRVPDILYFDP